MELDEMKFGLLKALIENGYAPDSAIDEVRILINYIKGNSE